MRLAANMLSLKLVLELLAEMSAVTAAILWFTSARVRLSRRAAAKRGLATGLDDPKALLRLGATCQRPMVPARLVTIASSGRWWIYLA